MRSVDVGIVGEWFCGTRGVLSRAQAPAADPAALGDGVVQVAQCDVDGTMVLVVHVSFPPASPAHREALAAVLRAHFGLAIVLAPVLDAAVGRLAIDPTFADDDARRDLAAAAAAVVQASWSWDESPQIDVELLGASRTVRVTPRHDGARWTATCESW